MLASAEAHYRVQQRATVLGVSAARRVWSAIAFADLTGSWLSLQDRMVTAVSAAQLLAARDADRYVGAALDEQSIPDSPAGQVVPSALVGVAGDGRELAGMLESAVIGVKVAVGHGLDERQAMASGRSRLDMLVATAVQDAGRAGVSVGTAARPAATGYVRMVSAGACSRCVILAGRFYRYNAGFLRHPGCSCRGVPSSEDHAGDLTTDPKAYFRSLSTAEQNRVFTEAGAEAIRLGSDMAQVVNARRGMRTATAYGRKVKATSEGMTRRGFAGRRTGPLAGGRSPRLMPEEIFRLADDRDHAIRLLRKHGFLT